MHESGVCGRERSVPKHVLSRSFPPTARPQVAEDLRYELVQRQAAGQTIAATEPGRTQSEKNLSAWFHAQIRKLLERGET